MAKQKDFDKYLSNIEPSPSTVQYVSRVQNNLRDYLKSHETYSAIYIDSFLSGSYAKHTSIRPAKDDKKRDVDIIIVTSHISSDDSDEVLDELRDALLDSKTYNTATKQHHSVGIRMGEVSIDVVPVRVCEEDDQLYYVCDSESGEWILTDPKGHKAWSTIVNKDNNNNYKPLVKVFKWWRRIHCPSNMKYPKGIALEKIIADNIGDSSGSTEDLLIETMDNIISSYKETYVNKKIVPTLDDPSDKIEGNNLLSGYTVEAFSTFICKIDEHLQLLNEEGTANETWRKILGTEFPKEAVAKSAYGLIVCESAPHRMKMPWSYAGGGAAFIRCDVFDENGNKIIYENNGEPLEKHCTLRFHAITGVKKPSKIMWQITNTGDEARQADCLRGNFELSNNGVFGRTENTLYTGSHSVQCFVLKNNVCVAKSKIYIINIK